MADGDPNPNKISDIDASKDQPQTHGDATIAASEALARNFLYVFFYY